MRIILVERENQKLLKFFYQKLCKDAVILKESLFLPGIELVFSKDGMEYGDIAIVNSDETWSIKLMAELKIPAVTCGLSSKDTFTFSSKSDENAVISLMRSVKSVYKNLLEPMEIPISFSKDTDEFFLLSFVATLVLTEKILLKNSSKIYRL